MKCFSIANVLQKPTVISYIAQFDCVTLKHNLSVDRHRLLSHTLRVILGSILLVFVIGG